MWEASFPLLHPRSDINEDTRISWKTGACAGVSRLDRCSLPTPLPSLAGCSRYTTGTPNYAVNGLPVDAGGFTLAQWEALLDPLFAGPQKVSAAARAAQRALHRTGGHS